MAEKNSPKRKSRFNMQQIALMLLAIVVGFFLWTEHRAHVLGVLPYMILLLCPVIHLFMHRGHGGTHNEHQENNDQK